MSKYGRYKHDTTIGEYSGWFIGWLDGICLGCIFGCFEDAMDAGCFNNMYSGARTGFTMGETAVH